MQLFILQANFGYRAVHSGQPGHSRTQLVAAHYVTAMQELAIGQLPRQHASTTS